MNQKVIIGVVAAVAAVTIIVGVTLGVLNPWGFSQTFMRRCEKFPEGNKDCKQILGVFEQAYVGKDKCNVPVSAYDPLMTTVPFTHSCSKTMLWSGTEDLVHGYAKERGYVTITDTLLGYILNVKNLTWCGKEGSTETITSDCPKYDECENPVRSFWRRASAGFAKYACGKVTVMLDGSVDKPFNPTSTFAMYEIDSLRFRSREVTHLIVILVTGEKSKCNSPNLDKELRNKVEKKNIQYKCEDVPKSQIKE